MFIVVNASGGSLDADAVYPRTISASVKISPPRALPLALACLLAIRSPMTKLDAVGR